MRTSNNQLTADGTLLNGYDYENQAWVIGGVYADCGHPQAGEKFLDLASVPAHQANLLPSELRMYQRVFNGCNCYGRAHAGEQAA